MLVAWVGVPLGAIFAVGLIAAVLLVIRWRPLQGPAKLDLAGKHVVITGGSSGIGKAVASLCVTKNAHVTIIARSQNRLDEAKDELNRIKKSDSIVIQAISADVTSAVDFENAIKLANRTCKRDTDILVCSAGATNPLRFEELSVTDFEDVMKVNFLGIVNCVKAVLPIMKKQLFGRIVLVSSQVGQVGMFGYTAYAASKFAVRGFAECLYPEVKPFNVHVSVSYPPDTDTPMYEEEMIKKPIETKLMSESGSVFKPEQIAKDIVNGIENWQFSISHGFDGKVLAILSGTLAPASSILGSIVEASTVGVLRLVWVYYVLADWYGIALREHKRANQK